MNPALSFLIPLLLLTSVYAQPTDESLLDEATLKRVSDAALVAEQANACGLAWQPYYLTFMQVERGRDWTQLQLAYMGAYFGAMQGFHAENLGPCDSVQRSLAQRALDRALTALRADPESYYPANRFVHEPRLTLPERSLEATERLCLEILLGEFGVPAPQNAADYTCYALPISPEEAMARFRSKLVILGYKRLREGRQEVMFALWQRPGSADTLLLAAVPSDGGAYLVALDSSAGDNF